MRAFIVQYSPARAWDALLLPVFAGVFLMIAAWNAPVEKVFSAQGALFAAMMTGVILLWYYVLGRDAARVIDLQNSNIYVEGGIFYFFDRQA